MAEVSTGNRIEFVRTHLVAAVYATAVLSFTAPLARVSPSPLLLLILTCLLALSLPPTRHLFQVFAAITSCRFNDLAGCARAKVTQLLADVILVAAGERFVAHFVADWGQCGVVRACHGTLDR